MSGKNINFNDKKIKKSIFYKNRAINNIEDIDLDNILVSKKNRTVIKTYLNTLFNDVIRPLCIRLPQMSGWIC